MLNSIDISEGIIIGAIGGGCAGLSVLIVSYLGRLWSEYCDKKQIYGWMQDKTSNINEKRYRSTRAISSWNNLTEDRVRYICSIHPKIFLSTGEKEDMWSLFRVNDYQPSGAGIFCDPQ